MGPALNKLVDDNPCQPLWVLSYEAVASLHLWSKNQQKEQREILLLLLLLCVRATVPLEACLEGSADLAINQQVDHNEDGNNPATDYSQSRMSLGETKEAKKVDQNIDDLHDQGAPIRPGLDGPQSPG